MTAVEWFADELKQFGYHIPKIWFEAAKEMEEEQMEITWNNAIDAQLKDKWDSYDDFHKTTFKSEQTEDTLKLVLNDIENTPEDVFNKQWESIKKKLKKPLKDSNPITKYLKSE